MLGTMSSGRSWFEKTAICFTNVEGTNPIAGTYNSKKEFLAGTVMILRKALKPGFWDVEITNVIAGGEQAAVELTVTSEVDHSKINC
jgi:hypothetical protein